MSFNYPFLLYWCKEAIEKSPVWQESQDGRMVLEPPKPPAIILSNSISNLTRIGANSIGTITWIAFVNIVQLLHWRWIILNPINFQPCLLKSPISKMQEF